MIGDHADFDGLLQLQNTKVYELLTSQKIEMSVNIYFRLTFSFQSNPCRNNTAAQFTHV